MGFLFGFLRLYFSFFSLKLHRSSIKAPRKAIPFALGSGSRHAQALYGRPHVVALSKLQEF